MNTFYRRKRAVIVPTHVLFPPTEFYVYKCISIPTYTHCKSREKYIFINTEMLDSEVGFLNHIIVAEK